MHPTAEHAVCGLAGDELGPLLSLALLGTALVMLVSGILLAAGRCWAWWGAVVTTVLVGLPWCVVAGLVIVDRDWHSLGWSMLYPMVMVVVLWLLWASAPRAGLGTQATAGANSSAKGASRAGR